MYKILIGITEGINQFQDLEKDGRVDFKEIR